MSQPYLSQTATNGATPHLNMPDVTSHPVVGAHPLSFTPPRPFNATYRLYMNSDELEYWRQYGVGSSDLKRYGVRAIGSYEVLNEKSGEVTLVTASSYSALFAYSLDERSVHVHTTSLFYSEEFNWPTGRPDTYVFGLAQLSKNGGPLLLLAANEKDALVLNVNGFPAITLGSTDTLLPAGLWDTVRELGFEQIAVCYPADKNNRQLSHELSAQNDLPWIELPVEASQYGKDASAFFKATYQGLLTVDLFYHAMDTLHQPERRKEQAGFTDNGLIRLRTAEQRKADAQNAPVLVPLWGPLWESPGISILAGEPGAGKSLLAVHVAHAVSSATQDFLGLFCAANEKVLYYDFELTDRQFERRFENFTFTDNLIIGEFNPESTAVEFTFEAIKADLIATGAKLIIIDNITALALKSTADADASMAVMRGLKKLQSEHGVSSMVLAHPPKLPVGVKLSINHVGGSKNITNFADSVFFIAPSAQGSNLRYIKQVKNRSGEMIPDVLVCAITDHEGHLGFTLVGPDEERNHLAKEEASAGADPENDAAVEKLRELWHSNPTIPQSQLAIATGRSKAWVNKYLKRLRSEHGHGGHAAAEALTAVTVTDGISTSPTYDGHGGHSGHTDSGAVTAVTVTADSESTTSVIAPPINPISDSFEQGLFLLSSPAFLPIYPSQSQQ